MALVSIWLAGVVPQVSGMAPYVEESAGFVRVLPDWAMTEHQVSAPAGGVQIVSQARQPVGGALWPDGRYLPLMVDGHVSALPFWSEQWALAVGGVTGARAVSVATGVAVLWALWWLGHAFGAPLAGWLTVLLLATSANYTFWYQWARPDEQWSWAMPLFALVAGIHHARTGGRGWLVMAGLAIGCAITAKITSILVLGGMLIGASTFGQLRHLRRSDFAWVAASAVPPLVPQVLWMALGNQESLNARVRSLPAIRELLRPQRLAWFFGHFLDSFGAIGSFIAEACAGRPLVLSPVQYTAAGLVLITLLATLARSFRRALPTPQRAFGLGLAIALVGYLAIYYTGQSFFGLLAIWIVFASALALAALWRSGPLRRVRQGLMVAAVLVLCGNGVAEIHAMHRLVSDPQYDLLSRDVHKQLAGALVAQGVLRPWTTTHNIVATLEVATSGRVRPHHAFGWFRQASSAQRNPQQAYDLAWDSVLALARRTDGEHSDFVLQPSVTPMDVSPLVEGNLIAARFSAAVSRAGATVTHQEAFAAKLGGRELIRWVTVRWPDVAITRAQDSISRSPRLPPQRASEAERAFLRPLTEGRSLGGFQVRELRPVEKGSLRIVCERDGARVNLDIALLGPESPSPPAMAGPYAVYYSLERASQADGERLARELEKILTANAAVPPPPGLQPYPADPRRLMDL
jgi:hypothetical protein